MDSPSVLSSAAREAKLHKAHEEHHKRKQREAERMREEEFLRTSLRSSDRLKALESAKRAADRAIRLERIEGQANEAFQDDDFERNVKLSVRADHSNNSTNVGSILPVGEVPNFLHELHSSLEHSPGYRGGSISEAEWSQLNSFVSSPSFSQAYHLQERLGAVMVKWGHPSPECETAHNLLNQVLAQLNAKGTSSSAVYQIAELKLLLAHPDIQSVIAAHDEVVSNSFLSEYHRTSDGSNSVLDLEAVHVDMSNYSDSESPSFKKAVKSPRERKVKSPEPKRFRGNEELHSDTLSSPQSPTDVDDSTLIGRHASIRSDNTASIIYSALPNCYATCKRSTDGYIMKTVVLQKNDEPLGATVRNEGDAVVIGRIVAGGVAYKSGLLCEGDEVLAVNSIDMLGKDVNTVSDLLSRMNGEIIFEIAPTDTKGDFQMDTKTEVIFQLRALFTYHPDDDDYIPCKEIGLAFEKGNIIFVMNNDDPNWWQGYLEGDDLNSNRLAGLFPSPEFQKTRERVRREHEINELWEKSGPANDKGCCPWRRKQSTPVQMNGSLHGLDTKRKSKNHYSPSDLEHIEANDIHTYEIVDQYIPQPHRKRPIVLVGPSKVGRHELLMRIIESDPEKFSPAVCHTSRLPGHQEINDKDYFFISKNEFQTMIDNNEFIEYGQYEREWYGTSRSVIADVIAQGKVCVMSLQPESIKAIRETSFLPYVIFISPSSNINTFRNLRMQLNNNGIRPPDEELLRTIEKSREIEERFGHWFDDNVVNNDLDRSFQRILTQIQTLETEPQWVPKDWIYRQSTYQEREIKEYTADDSSQIED